MFRKFIKKIIHDFVNIIAIEEMGVSANHSLKTLKKIFSLSFIL